MFKIQSLNTSCYPASPEAGFNSLAKTPSHKKRSKLLGYSYAFLLPVILLLQKLDLIVSQRRRGKRRELKMLNE
ncbi:hypothetical protein MMU07_06905 [Aquiflexum sp. LQ15W]|uniref:hypothetical protein n=1 Tax=Cognataquiflexum nitidum TaxID=2922272 RepID=UPI001F12B444|nr:hypothetical protein [Cognataquiflexum nitidum]MCH6199298.1 hypothetical protein [Cognataquiflexum nitidum]